MSWMTVGRKYRPEGYVKVRKDGSIIFLCCSKEERTKYKEKRVCERISFLYNWRKRLVGIKFPPGFHLLLRERGLVTTFDLERKIIEVELERLQQNGANSKEGRRTLTCLKRARKKLSRHYFEPQDKSAMRFGNLMRKPSQENGHAPR